MSLYAAVVEDLFEAGGRSMARLRVRGVEIDVDAALVPEAAPGDTVLVEGEVAIGSERTLRPFGIEEVGP